MTKKTFSLLYVLSLFLASPSFAQNSGLFLSQMTLPVNSSAEAVALGDVNNDGRTDVLMTTGYNNVPDEDYKLFVYLQGSDGALAAPVKYDVPKTRVNPSIRSVDVGDLNGDGLEDVAVAAENSIGVFYQNINGDLDPVIGYSSGHISNTNVQKLRIGDFNGDTRLDVVSIDKGYTITSVEVFLQNVSGSLDPPLMYTVPYPLYSDLQVGDVNGDGRTDVVVFSFDDVSSVYDTIAILHQNESGTFNAPLSYVFGGGQTGNGIALGDLTGDGLNDIAVLHGGNKPNAFVSVLAQNDAGTLDAPAAYAAYDIPGPGAVADVNLDGREDLLVANNGWDAVTVYIQSESGTLMPYERYDIPQPHAAGYGGHALAAGDINSDGLTDLVLAYEGGSLIVLYHAPLDSQVTLTMESAPAAGGTTSPFAGSHMVDPGEETNITATAAPGYIFSGWSANPASNATFGSASLASTSVTLSGDATVTAIFRPPTISAFTPTSGVLAIPELQISPAKAYRVDLVRLGEPGYVFELKDFSKTAPTLNPAGTFSLKTGRLDLLAVQVGTSPTTWHVQMQKRPGVFVFDMISAGKN